MLKHKRRYIRFLITILLTTVLASCQISTTQHSKEKRIVSTTVATTEVLAALKIDIVGKPTTAKTLPEVYRNVPEVGMAKSVDIEKVSLLKPTHILSLESIRAETQPIFAQLNITPNYYNFDTVNKMMTSIVQIGQDFDKKEAAKQLNTKFEKVLNLAKQQAHTTKPKVLVLMGVPGSYLVATNQSYIGNMVELLGAENIVQSEDTAYLSSNTEYLNQAQPDIILRQSHAMPKQVHEMFDKEFKDNQIWQRMTAVKAQKVYDLDDNLFGINARINADEAMLALYEILYGEPLNDQ